MPEKYRALIWLGFYSGLPPAELLGLTWDRIDFESRTITVDSFMLPSMIMAWRESKRLGKH